MLYLKFISVLVPVMLVIDALWIGAIAKGFYKNNLGYIMSGSIVWVPAIIFYILYIFGLVYFVIIPGVATGDIVQTVIRGALFGLIAYGTYDLTNHATLRSWPAIVTVVDMAWGAILTGAVAAVGHYVSKWFM